MTAYTQVIASAKATFSTGRTKTIAYRKQQLRNLAKLLTENEAAFVEALQTDLAKSRFETIMTEVDFVLNDVRSALNNIDEWVKPKFVSKSFVTLVDDNYIHYEPYGLVLVIGAWNYPVQLALSPLVGAIAAGNVCLVKPSEIARATGQLISRLMGQYLDQEAYKCILGDGGTVQKLIDTPGIDHVFYTGSSHVGRMIYEAAAKQLIPCTLELGGKSPVYIDEQTYLGTNGQFDSKLFETTVRRILWGKFLNSGQTCVAPDYVLCTRFIQEKFMSTARTIIDQFYGQYPMKNADYGRIVSARHYQRLTDLIREQMKRQSCHTMSCDYVLGADYSAAPNNNGDYYIEPTVFCLASHDPNDEPLMREEIFGPILPLVPVVDIDEALAYVNSRDKPLSLYIFTRSASVIDAFKNQTSSGSICVNDTVLHLIAEALPFGGVGKSGIGAYHGRHSFDTFSHQKSMLVRGFNPIIEWVAKKRYPPYSENHLRRMLRLLKRRRNPLPISGSQMYGLIWFLAGIFVAYIYLQLLARTDC